MCGPYGKRSYLGAVMGDLNGRPHGQEQMFKVAQEE